MKNEGTGRPRTTAALAAAALAAAAGLLAGCGGRARMPDPVLVEPVRTVGSYSRAEVFAERHRAARGSRPLRESRRVVEASTREAVAALEKVAPAEKVEPAP